MKDLECEEWNLKFNAGFDREPMKLLQGRSDVVNRGSSGDDTSGCVLDQLEFLKKMLHFSIAMQFSGPTTLF